MNGQSPGVSCIVRTCNRPEFLTRAFSSLSSQSFRDVQVIVVNDGGDPAPVDLAVTSLSNQRPEFAVNVIHHPKQSGRWVAANAGLALASKKYVHIHDDDDTIHPDFYSKIVRYLESTDGNYFGACSYIQCVEEQGDPGSYEEKARYPWPHNRQGICIADMAIRNGVVPIGLVYERKMHDLVGQYRSELPVLGDWDFYLQALCHASIAVLPEELAYYYLRTANSGANANSIHGNLTEHLQYDALIRDHYFRNHNEHPQLSHLLQTGRMFRETRRHVEIHGSPLRLLVRKLLKR